MIVPRYITLPKRFSKPLLGYPFAKEKGCEFVKWFVDENQAVLGEGMDLTAQEKDHR